MLLGRRWRRRFHEGPLEGMEGGEGKGDQAGEFKDLFNLGSLALGPLLEEGEEKEGETGADRFDIPSLSSHCICSSPAQTISYTRATRIHSRSSRSSSIQSHRASAPLARRSQASIGSLRAHLSLPPLLPPQAHESVPFSQVPHRADLILRSLASSQAREPSQQLSHQRAREGSR